jgi:nucleoside-triphosphatase THEP1
MPDVQQAHIDEMADLLLTVEKLDFPVHLNAHAIVTLIAVIQLARRHPMAKASKSIQDAVMLARKLQDHLDGHAPGIGRLLEKGWHEVFDVRTDKPVAAPIPGP